MTDDERREWHLDRRFSVALIAALLGQIGTAVWFASKTDSRIETLEGRYLELAKQTAANRQWQIDERVRIWERVNDQDAVLNDLRAEAVGNAARLDYISRALERLTFLNDQRVRDERKGD